jgi:hypothetical protein
MLLRILVIVIFSFVAYSVHADQDKYIRGAVIWTDEKQTVTECITGRVYWIQILASNPHFLFSKKIEKHKSKGYTIIAEFRGEVTGGIPSLGPQYPVDGTLSVHQVVSVQLGTCEK